MGHLWFWGVFLEQQNIVNLKSALPKEAFAGFWIRFVALMIDSLVLLFPDYLVHKALVVISAPNPAPSLLVSFPVSVLFALTYYGFLQAQLEGSVGKKILGLALVKDDGEKLGLKEATVRYFMTYVSGLFGFIGYVVVASDAHKQAWHDRAAGTVVVTRDALLEWRNRPISAEKSDSLPLAA
jgi:uncharacterized RDD family membrane protein YckC